MNAITKALQDSERSYRFAKATVANLGSDIMAQGPSGSPFANQQSMNTAKQQLKAFSSWVYSALRPICNVIAAQPIVVSRKSGSTMTGSKAKSETVIENHAAVRLIQNPNELMTGYSLVWATVASIGLTGRAFWWLPEDVNELHLIPVSWVLGHNGTTSFKSWNVLPPGHTEPIEIPGDRMVYFAMPDPGDPWGAISPLQACAGAVNNDSDILQSQRSTFSRGIHPSHAIIVGKQPTQDGGARVRLSEKQARQVISAIKRRYVGTAKHGEPLILDALIEDVKQLSHTPSEMDWTNSADKMKERILQTFGTSPYILGGSEPGSRAASAVAMKHFMAGTVNPLIRLMSEALTEWMGPIFDGVSIRIEEAVADDDEMEMRRAELLSKNGALKVNELRTMLGLPEDEAFNGQLVGGSNMGTTSMIEQGLERMVHDAFGSVQADSILEQINGRRISLPSANGNGRH